MPTGIDISRITGAEFATIDRKRVQVFFQRFPGTNAASGIQGLDFTVTIDGVQAASGTTPADGKVEILLGAGEAAVLEILGSQYDVRLLSGALHPVAELRGVQQRLNMLGYNAGPLETPAAGATPVQAATSQNQNQGTEQAIINFQSDNKSLFIDGIAGTQTQPKLQQIVRSAGGE